MANDQVNEIFQEFLIESFENLSDINDEVTQFEKDPTQMDLLNSIYRKVHTVKGSASFLNLKKLQGVTHVSENLLDLIRSGEMKIDTVIVDILLDNFDVCADILRIIESTGEEGDGDYSQVIAKTIGIIEKSIHPKEIIKEEIHILEEYPGIVKQQVIIKNDDISSPVTELKKQESLNIIKPLNEQKIEVAKKTPLKKDKNLKDKNMKEKKKPVAENKNATPKSKGVVDSVVKVNVQLLDKIMNVVGELVLNRNQIMQYAQSQDSSELNLLVTSLDGITSELQQDVMTTRMQPVGSVLNKFERIVRDLARQQNKKIQLNLSGQDTELDKSLIESIKDPLTHLIRNSVDHGIENPIDRIEKGKDEIGSINIKAYHEGGQVTIEIQDDGNGIHPDMIRDKAESKGVVSKEKLDSMSDAEVLNLIFAPGFSTAEQVTSISGRGVGMDVVKSNIEKIRGTVDISSIPGEGTSFKLRIPLTLAIVPSLIVRDCGETYAIPQTNLVELVRVSEESKNQIEKVHDSEFYRLRERLIPIFRLSSIFDNNVSLNNISKNNEVKLDALNVEDDSLNIVVLNSDGVIYGLIVDIILDTEEIVVKPLSKKLKDTHIYAGATIMGDGSVALIVDAMGFYGHVTESDSESKGLIDKHDEKVINNIDESHEYVLCELHNNEVIAFPLCYVNRLEEFMYQDIERSGDSVLIRYRNNAIPLLDISQMFGDKENNTTVLKDFVSHPTLVIERNGSYIGLIVKEIRDIAVSTENINQDICSGNGVLGTVYINQKTITVLDLYGILDHYNYSNTKNLPKTGAKGARILLLEDSPLYQKMICQTFFEHEHEVVVCSDGEIGLEKIKHDGKFDLVVSDINMPNIDGPSFMKQVRAKKNEDYCDIPIIAISTDIKEKDAKQGIKDGFNYYIEKNQQDELLETIQKLLVA